MTTEELKKLKESMPRKYRETIATTFGISKVYVDKIFRGEAIRDDVIDWAIDMAQTYKEHRETQQAKIGEL